MASAPKRPKLNDEANFTRLCRLLVNKGTEALRQTFDACHPPSTLQAVLKTNQASLKKHRPKIINNDQWNLLYPASGNPDSKNFDITLLSVLLRNICNLSPPATGWSTMPSDTDRSKEANLVRVKLYRNKIFAHVTSTVMNDSEFRHLWPKISQTLEELGISKPEIDELKTCALSPEEENYIEILKDWKLKDEILDEINEKTTKLLKTTEELKESIPENTRKLQESIHEQSREIKESMAAGTNEIKQLMRGKQPESSSQADADENLLTKKLCKFKFDGDIRNFVKSFHPGTRKWLFTEVDRWFKEKESIVFVLTAGPGVGKTVLAAKIIDVYQEEKKSLAACHFCKFNNSNYSNPRYMIQSLASQMCDSVEGFKKKLLEQLKRPNKVQNLQDAFQVYLKEPLQQLPKNKPMLVVIDGLDECESDKRTELLDVLAKEFSKLPSWLKVLVTSRPEINVQKKLSSLKYMEIEPKDEKNEEETNNEKDTNNEADIKLYLTKHLPSQKEFISLLTKKCEGSFLFAFFLKKHLQKCELDFEKKRIEDLLPEGITSVYHEYFTRLEKELKAVSKEYDIFYLLNIISVARGPIPLSFITEDIKPSLDRRTMKDIIGKVNENVSTLLFVSNDLVTVFHKSVVDWLKLTDEKDHHYAVDCERGNELLWTILKKKFQEIKKNIREKKDRSIIDELKRKKPIKYALENGFDHLLPPTPSSRSRSEDYEWLVDVVLLHVMFWENFARLLKHWNDFLAIKTPCDSTTSSMTRIKEKIRWHYNHFSSVQIVPCYVQDIVNEGPSEIFSDEEKGIAKVILNIYVRFWCEKLHPFNLTPNIYVTACAFSPDGSRLVSCAADGRIHIWNMNSFEVVKEVLPNCEDAICCFWTDEILIFYHVESDLMLSKYPVNEDSNVEERKMTTTIGSGTFKPLAFSPKVFIYSCTSDSTIKILRFTDGSKISIAELYTMEEFAVNRDGSLIMAANKDHIEIWKISDETPTKCCSVKSKELNEGTNCCRGELKSFGLFFSSDQNYGIVSGLCTLSNEECFPHIFLINIESGEITISLTTTTYVGYDKVLATGMVGKTFLFLQNRRQIAVYLRGCGRPLAHFEHKGDFDYCEGTICHSDNIIALPQESGGICLVKLHLPNLDYVEIYDRYTWPVKPFLSLMPEVCVHGYMQV